MTVEVRFECGGCFKKAKGTTWIKERLVPIFGATGGLCTKERTPIEDVAPEGWVAFDPYTGCCYCPECWESVIGDDEEEASDDPQ